MIKNKMGAFWEIWLLSCLIFVNLRFFSYLQKFAIFMRWEWKIWVDHNKTDYGSIGGISEVTNKLYKIASILHTKKFSTCKFNAFFIHFHGQITPKLPKYLSPSPWQPDIDTKILTLVFEFLHQRAHLVQISSKSETCHFQPL